MKCLVHWSNYGAMITVSVEVRDRHKIDGIADAVFQATLKAQQELPYLDLHSGWDCEVWTNSNPKFDETWKAIHEKGDVEHFPSY